MLATLKYLQIKLNTYSDSIKKFYKSILILPKKALILWLEPANYLDATVKWELLIWMLKNLHAKSVRLHTVFSVLSSGMGTALHVRMHFQIKLVTNYSVEHLFVGVKHVRQRFIREKVVIIWLVANVSFNSAMYADKSTSVMFVTFSLFNYDKETIIGYGCAQTW